MKKSTIIKCLKAELKEVYSLLATRTRKKSQQCKATEERHKAIIKYLKAELKELKAKKAMKAMKNAK